MAGLLATYNRDVMATPCRRCGVGSRERCRGRAVTAVTAAHAIRIQDAGYRWDRTTQRLEAI